MKPQEQFELYKEAYKKAGAAKETPRPSPREALATLINKRKEASNPAKK